MNTLPRDVFTVSKRELEQFKQGRRVGCYLLGKTVGEGSFAKVKEAIHIVTGEKVAVKIIDKKRAREDRYICKNLRREARILQLVRHANIIQLLEVLETDNYYYLVMEFCAGGELLDYICSKKRLDESTAKRIVAQLVSAVDTMHKAGIVHRDLKIENFLLNENEDLKIIDFGLSNTMPSPCMTTYEKTGVFPQSLNTHCGSPAYAAPELLAQKQYGPQVDVWSIGINMYAMLTGFLPYMMEPFNVMEMYEKMMQRKMTPVPGFLSKECRDLLMRLLEPVPEWRITLRQVIKHKWFTGTDYIPRCTSLGDMMYDKKELCESVLSYMKYNLKIKTKDTINAVVTNRAVHSSAIYHLLVRRLDRYLKEKKLPDNINKQFPKVEVIKKAILTNDNTTSKTKKFSFHGRKIEPGSRSQPALAHEITNNLEDETTINESKNCSNVHYDENNNHYTRIQERETQKAKDSQNKVVKRHVRSSSSADSNTLLGTIRNSLTCSTEDLSKYSPEPHLPKQTFNRKEESFVTSRKKSFDGILDETLDSPNGDDKEIDVTIYLLPDESQRNKVCLDSSEEKKPLRRSKSSSIDLPIDDNEENVKEQKEPSSGWSITKIVKQPPLKTEHIIRDNAHKDSPGNSVNQINLREGSPSPITSTCEGSTSPIISTHKKISTKTLSDPGIDKTVKKFEPTRRNSEKLKTVRPDSPEKSRTIRRPETPEKLRTIRRPETPDFNHNFTVIANNETDCNSRTKHTNFKKDKIREKAVNEQSFSAEPLNRVLSRDTATSELEDILQNVRYINKNHLNQNVTDIDRLLSTPESENSWKPPDKETMRTIHDSKMRVRRVFSADNTDSNSPSPVNISPWILKQPETGKTDENNNGDSTKTQLELNDAPPKGMVKSRMAKLESLDKENEQPNQKEENSSQIRPFINKIMTGKKTLELNVKQFAQFKFDDKPKNGENAHTFESMRYSQQKGLVVLKPLEINFNFKLLRKKKPYQKQQTRSLTDLTTAGTNDTTPCATQILSPKVKHGSEDVKSPGSTKQSEEDSLHTNTMASKNEGGSKIFKTVVKITSFGSKSTKSNKTKIFISGKKDGKDESIKHDNKKTIQTKKTTTIKKTSHGGEEFTTDELTDHRKKLDSSSDSGYFGNNYSSSTDDENQASSPRVGTPPKKSEKMMLHEVQQAKYRCNPVHKPEITTTPRVYTHDSSGDLDVIREESNDPRNAARVKRSGSLNVERTQERLGFIPRSAEFKRNILKQHRDEQNKREQHHDNNQVTNSVAIKKKIRTQSCKQYPIERTVIGSASPKFHRTASFGMTRSTSRSLPVSPCPSPTLFDASFEKNKIMAFTHALEKAAWRKRGSCSSMSAH